MSGRERTVEPPLLLWVVHRRRWPESGDRAAGSRRPERDRAPDRHGRGPPDPDSPRPAAGSLDPVPNLVQRKLGRRCGVLGRIRGTGGGRPAAGDRVGILEAPPLWTRPCPPPPAARSPDPIDRERVRVHGQGEPCARAVWVEIPVAILRQADRLGGLIYGLLRAER